MSLQVHRGAEELGISNTARFAHESSARANEKKRSDPKAMGEPVFGRVQPSKEAGPFYIVQECVT